jgi:hypothetical protein
MKTTVEVSDWLFMEAKAYAEARGVPLRQIVEEGLRTAIRQSPTGRRRFRLRDGSFGPSRENATWSKIRRTIYDGRGEDSPGGKGRD